ncbi:flagellar hook-associated protein FlgK [Amaricoccus macauensis]|uniref:flagellar hook-associated protein FlgK n=1 Tax=Amaricoccus macauensis TaxID=57001 RepID=UPI003C7D6CF9
MSIASAFNSAASGLRANSRLVETVAKNVSNALTPGYARRTTEVSSTFYNGQGAGVAVVGTSRAENAQVTAERRAADSSLGAASTLSSAYSQIMDLIGTSANEAGSLMGLVDDMEAGLISLAASPDSTTAQATVLTSAQAIADKLNAVTADNNTIRTDVENSISAQVDTVNASLHKVDELNEKIAAQRTLGNDTTSLEDERARLVDDISSIVPVSTVKRDNGMIGIYSTNGGVLLNAQVYELSFEPNSGGVTAEMTLGAPLGSLMQDQGSSAGPVTVDAGIGSGKFDGGSLGALFELRDSVVPDYQSEVDAFATDLIERFRDLMPAGFVDGAGDGLFVDAGAGVGVAGRIEINTAVDPDQGGEIWRLRDGLSAASEGDKGFTEFVLAMSDAMATDRSPAGFTYQTASADSSAMASGIASYFSGLADRADEDMSFLSSLQASLAQNEINETGVDSDEELAHLMVLEDAYAANARVMSAIDELMQRILEI